LLDEACAGDESRRRQPGKRESIKSAISVPVIPSSAAKCYPCREVPLNYSDAWSVLIKVNDGATKFERVIGAYPAVDHNTGVVYDSWHDYAKNIIYVQALV
jgi:hypothetical protein